MFKNTKSINCIWSGSSFAIDKYKSCSLRKSYCVCSLDLFSGERVNKKKPKSHRPNCLNTGVGWCSYNAYPFSYTQLHIDCYSLSFSMNKFVFVLVQTYTLKVSILSRNNYRRILKNGGYFLWRRWAQRTQTRCSHYRLWYHITFEAVCLVKQYLEMVALSQDFK